MPTPRGKKSILDKKGDIGPRPRSASTKSTSSSKPMKSGAAPATPKVREQRRKVGGKVPPAEQKKISNRTKRAMKATKKSQAAQAASKAAAKAATKKAAGKLATKAIPGVGAALAAKDVYDAVKKDAKVAKATKGKPSGSGGQMKRGRKAKKASPMFADAVRKAGRKSGYIR